MAIIKRAKRKEKYCVLPNAFLQDNTLSFECRGMIAYLLSHTDDWVCRPGDLEREGKIGRDARRTIMKEAERAGYLTFHTERLKNGQFNTWYDAHEQPVTTEERTASWETGKSKPTTGFTLLPGPDKPGAVESYDGQAVPILSTEARSTDLRIGDIDIPQTPSLVENPKANFPLANGDEQSVHAQPCKRDLNGSCVNHPYTMEGCTEPGRLYRLQAEKDWRAKQAALQAALTVHANGGIATPPGVAEIPPTARQTDHQRMMAALHVVLNGQKIINGKAQGQAIKKILTGYTADQAIECLNWMADPTTWWNAKADWTTVQGQIADYFRRKEQQQTKLGGNYGQFGRSNGSFLPGDSSGETKKSVLQQLCSKRSLGDFG